MAVPLQRPTTLTSRGVPNPLILNSCVVFENKEAKFPDELLKTVEVLDILV